MPRAHPPAQARLRRMRGLKGDQTARVIDRGHALLQNIRLGQYELAVEAGIIGASRPR